MSRGTIETGEGRGARGEGRGARDEGRGARGEGRGAAIGSGSGHAAAMVRTAGIAWSNFCRSLGGVLFSVLLMSLLMSPLVSLGCGSSLDAVIVLPEGRLFAQCTQRHRHGRGRRREVAQDAGPGRGSQLAEGCSSVQRV